MNQSPTFPHHGEDEVWLPVPGWDDIYDVSNLGRVRSQSRRYHPGRILKPFPTPNGYLLVDLSRGNVRTRWAVHRLVAVVFLGPCPPGQQVRHGPNGKLDNRASQLCYGTAADDAQDRIRDGVTLRGERNNHAKLTAAVVTELRRRYAEGASTYLLAREFGVGHHAIAAAVCGETWFYISGQPVTMRTARGEYNGHAKLNDAAVAEIRRRRAAGEAQKDLALEFGVDRSVISTVVHRKTWRHVA